MGGGDVTPPRTVSADGGAHRRAAIGSCARCCHVVLFFVLLFVLLLALGTASAAAPITDAPVLHIIQMAAITLVLVVPMLLPGPYSWRVVYHKRFALSILALLSVAYVDLLSEVDGRRLVHGWEGVVRGALVQVPLSQRGAAWSAAEFLTTLLMSYPLSQLAGGRAAYWDTLFDANGPTTSTLAANAVAYSSYAEVSTRLKEVEQPDGMLIGGSTVSPSCFAGNSTLLFVGASEPHQRMRKFLEQYMLDHSTAGGDNAESLLSIPAETAGEEDISVTELVRRTTVREVFTRMWGTPPAGEAEGAMMRYFELRSLCWLPANARNVYDLKARLLSKTGGLKEVEEIRTAATRAVMDTAGGKAFHTAAAQEFPGREDDALAAAVDGMLFAGVSGTATLADGIIARVAASPSTMLPLWSADRRAFIIEQARLNPPVLTSVNTVVRETSNVTIGAGWLGRRTVEMEAGSVTQLVLSKANRDPKVFGGALQLRSRANTFDPTRGSAEHDSVLTFNNVLLRRSNDDKRPASDAVGPGYGLSLEVTIAVVEAFLPSIKPRKEEAAEPELQQEEEPQSPRVNQGDFDAVILGRASLLDDIAFVIWGCCCLWGIVTLGQPRKSPPPAELILRLKDSDRAAETWQQSPRLIGRHYRVYLLGQLATAIGHFVGKGQLQHYGQAVAAAAYAALACRVQEYFRQRDAWGSQAAPDDTVAARRRAQPAQSSGLSKQMSRAVTGPRSRWKALSSTVRHTHKEQHFTYEYAGVQDGYTETTCFMLLISMTLAFGHSFAPHSFAGEVWVVVAFYTPACLAGYLSIWRFLWRCKDDPAAQRTWVWGVVGGTFGIANLFWPLLFPPYLYHLLSRIADSLLYVPLVLGAVSRMDDELWAAVPWTEEYAGLHEKLDRGFRGMPLKLAIAAFVVAGCSWETFSPLLLEVTHSMGVHSSLQLCHNAADVAAYPEACAAGTEHLRAVDGHTRAVFLVNQVADHADHDELPPSSVAVPRFHGPLEAYKPHTALLPGTGFDVLLPSFDVSNDAHLQSSNSSEILEIQAKQHALNALRGWSIIDIDTPWADPADGAAIVRAVGERSLAALVLRSWSEMTSDDAISQWAFAGLAAHAIKAHTGGKSAQGVAIKFEVDYSWMSAFKVRPGFEKYGATAYFGADRSLLMMHWDEGGLDVMPGDERWEHAKWAWKCSCLVGVTLKDHLVGVHFEQANTLYTTTIEQLPQNHPVRRLLLPHIYGTPTINYDAAVTLATNRGILHHAVALEWEALQEAFVASRAALRLDSFWLDEHLSSRGMGSGETEEDSDFYPWGYEMRRYVSVVETMVARYIDVYYPDDGAVAADSELRGFVAAFPSYYRERIGASFDKKDVVDLLTTSIVYVTGMHNHLGNIADYVRSPMFVSPKIRAGTEVSDRQATLQALNIGLLTALKAPPLHCARQQLEDDCYAHLLLEDEHLEATTRILKGFQRQLSELSAGVKQRNEKRGGYACSSFDPATMTSSVSI